MNNSQIDTLLKLPLPRTDGGVASSRGRDEGSPFDQLFQQASETSKPTATAPAPRPRSDQNSAPPRPKADDRPTSAPPAANECSRPDDSAESRQVASNDERDDDEPDASEVAVADVHVQSRQGDDKEASDESASDKAESTEAVVDHAAKPKGKHAIAAKQKAEAEALAEDATDAADAKETADIKKVDADPVVDGAAKPAAASTEEGVAEKTGELATELQAEPTELKAANAEVVDGEKSTEARPVRKRRIDGSSQTKAAEKAAADAGGEVKAKRGKQSDEAKVDVVAEDAKSQSTAKQAAVPTEGVTTAVGRADSQNKSGGDDKSSESQRETTASDNVGKPAKQPQGPATAIPAVVAANVAASAAEGAANGTLGTDAKPKQIGGESKEGVLATFARFERNALLGGRGALRGGESHETPHVDPARFVSRVAKAIQTAQDRGTPLLLRLNPPELGSLRLEISVQQGALSATVEADNPNAKQILLDNLPALRDRLADQNIRIERFDVDVRRDGEGREQPNFQPQQNQQQQNTSPQRRGRSKDVAAPAAIEAVSAPSPTITNSSINVVA